MFMPYTCNKPTVPASQIRFPNFKYCTGLKRIKKLSPPAPPPNWLKLFDAFSLLDSVITLVGVGLSSLNNAYIILRLLFYTQPKV